MAFMAICTGHYMALVDLPIHGEYEYFKLIFNTLQTKVLALNVSAYRLWAHAWFTKIVFVSVCMFVCM